MIQIFTSRLAPKRGRWLAVASALSCALILASCSPSTPSSPGPSGVTGSARLSASPSPVAPVQLPAGVQYDAKGDAKAETLPATSQWPGPLAFSADGASRIMIGSRPGQIWAGISAATGVWKEVLVDDEKGIAAPAPFSVNHGVSVAAIAGGLGGFMAVGSGNFWTPGNYSETEVAVGWFSADGSVWQRINLAAVVGSGHSFRPTSVASDGKGFVAIGDISDTARNAKGAIEVVKSPDGIHWSVSSAIEHVWAVGAGTVVSFGKMLIAYGLESACNPAARSLDISAADQFRFWTSTDGGATWVLGDSTAGGIIQSLKQMPTAVKDCPLKAGIEDLDRDYNTTGGFAGIAAGKAVFIGAGGKVATTTDLKSFQVGTLAGADPVASESSSDYRAPKASAVVPFGSGLAVLSLQPRRDASDRQAGAGAQVFAWTSADGATWKRLPAARPVLLRDYDFGEWTNFSMVPAPDGTVVLIDQGGGEQGIFAPVLFHSSAGLLKEWGSCKLGKGADCSFTTVTGGTSGVDLSGADFTGSVITSELTGSTLTGVSFEGASVPGSVFAAKDLAGTDMTRAKVTIKTGDKSLENHDFGKMDLTGVSFDSDKQHVKADMRGVDFTQATISGTSFGTVDLTGAKFPTSSSTTAIFPSDDTICPDGQAPSPGRLEITACRVGPKPATP